MSDFIVSARKYRPATFSSVVGQKHITSTLKNAIERGQLAHAYLFCGPRGVGKTTCARIFAKAINCLHPEGAEACNTCESCRSFNDGRSLNIHELDAASNNSVEDIRSLIEQVRIIPQVGRYSVFIIDEVHMLSAAAFNAFLKTLEEPPAHAIFILATTEKHKIIPTILSRCQIYDFNRIRVEDSVEYLKYIASQEGITADDESLNLIAQKADGGMRDALSMFDKAVSFCGQELRYQEVAQTLNVLDYDTYFSMTETLLSGNYVEALLSFDNVLARGFSGQTFMAGLNRHLRDLLVARNEPSLRLLEFTGTLMERYRTQAAACPPEFLFGAISLLTGAAPDDHHVARFEVFDGTGFGVVFADGFHADRGEHLASDAVVFERRLERQRVDDRGEHAHLVALHAVEALFGAREAAEDVAAADDDADLDARCCGGFDLLGVGLQRLGGKPVFLSALQRFAAQFQEYSLVYPWVAFYRYAKIGIFSKKFIYIPYL